jgi:hypothetical protein
MQTNNNQKGVSCTVILCRWQMTVLVENVLENAVPRDLTRKKGSKIITTASCVPDMVIVPNTTTDAHPLASPLQVHCRSLTIRSHTREKVRPILSF